MARAVDSGEPPADHHAAVGLQGNRPDGVVRAGARVEAAVHRGVRVDAGNAVAGGAPELGEDPSDNDLAVGLDRHADGVLVKSGSLPATQGEGGIDAAPLRRAEASRSQENDQRCPPAKNGPAEPVHAARYPRIPFHVREKSGTLGAKRYVVPINLMDSLGAGPRRKTGRCSPKGARVLECGGKRSATPLWI